MSGLLLALMVVLGAMVCLAVFATIIIVAWEKCRNTVMEFMDDLHWFKVKWFSKESAR